VVFLPEKLVAEGLKPDQALYLPKQDPAEQARGMAGAAASRRLIRLFLVGGARSSRGTDCGVSVPGTNESN